MTITPQASRHRRRFRAQPLLLFLCAITTLLLVGSASRAAFADDPVEPELPDVEGERMSLGSLAFTLPQGWRLETMPDQDVGGQTAKAVRLIGLDPRLRVLILVAEPFGYDVSWDLQDLMAPVILDALSQEGAVEKRIKLEKTSCEFVHGHEPARMGSAEIIVDDIERLVTAVGCGISEPSRWALVLIVVDAAYQRPMAMQATVEQTVDLLKGMRFE